MNTEFESLLEKAAAGNLTAMVKVGNALRNGNKRMSVERNFAAGIEWLEKAANAGSVEAMKYLVSAYGGKTCAGTYFDFAAAEKADYWEERLDAINPDRKGGQEYKKGLCPDSDELDKLCKNPKLADKYDKWGDINGMVWLRLLERQPQFIEKCEFERFDGCDWAWFLSEYPQYADKCDKWDEIDGMPLGVLLNKQPQFAERCNLTSLDVPNWIDFVKKHPDLADKYDWTQVDDWNWRRLLTEYPQFAKYKEESERIKKEREAMKNKQKKVRKPARITWEKFQESVVGLDSSEAAVIMNMSCGDEDKEVSYDIDLKGPHGTVVISGTFTVDDDDKIVSIDEPDIEGDLYDDDDYERVYARLLRRFQGEQVFVPKDSPSVFF
jgi:hypothetical protein